MGLLGDRCGLTDEQLFIRGQRGLRFDGPRSHPRQGGRARSRWSGGRSGAFPLRTRAPFRSVASQGAGREGLRDGESALRRLPRSGPWPPACGAVVSSCERGHFLRRRGHLLGAEISSPGRRRHRRSLNRAHQAGERPDHRAQRPVSGPPPTSRSTFLDAVTGGHLDRYLGRARDGTSAPRRR